MGGGGSRSSNRLSVTKYHRLNTLPDFHEIWSTIFYKKLSSVSFGNIGSVTAILLLSGVN